MERTLSIRPRDLDTGTREYLKGVSASKHEADGIYIPQSGAAPGWGVILGAAGICWMLYKIFGNLLVTPDNWNLSIFAVSFLVFASSLLSVGRRMFDKNFIGDFGYLDGVYWWEVNVKEVKALLLRDLKEISVFHSYNNNGAYQNTRLSLNFPEGNVLKIISDMKLADKIDTALQFQTFEGNPLSPDLSSLLERKRTNRLDADYRAFYIIILLSALLGFMALPMTAQYLKDETMYADVGKAALTDKVWMADSYLAEFPDGRHTMEVVGIRDHSMFQIAKEELSNNKRASKLRDYLAAKTNILHREEAQQLIDGYYDTAIARMKSLANEHGLADKKLFDALIALLNSLKVARSPVVLVGFEPSIKETPADPLFEKSIYERMRDQNPKLKEIEASSSDHTAIIGVGETFSKTQIERRQGIIVDRLREALGTVLDSDIIQLEPCKPQAECQINVIYRTFPSGGLYLYTTSSYDSSSPWGKTKTETAGLLRGYDMNWRISIKPQGASVPYVIKLESAALSRLRMDASPDDPAWAPYAVILYSAFHDFSSKLIKNFGLKAAPPPNSFSFADATGKVSMAHQDREIEPGRMQ